MPTFEKPYRPLGVSIYNRISRLLSRCGLDLNSLTDEAIINAARREARLSDFGNDGFRVPLGQLLQSCREEARLHPLGRLLMRRRFVEILVNRLRLHADFLRHPGLHDVPIRRPLFVTGLPRTGTTLLYSLLAQDPAARPLMMWEAVWPSPPPTPETRDTDPRIKQARLLVKMAYRLAPQLPIVHPLHPDGPEEDLTLTLNTLVSGGFSMLAEVPGYEAWLRGLTFDDRVAAYVDYRRQLQLLQWRCAGDHWVLKSPVHMVALDALLNVFPDACVVQTHRDPIKAVPSLCSLIAVFRGMSTDSLDFHALGQWGMDNCAELLDRAAAAREGAGERVFDVRYAELIRDPIGTVHRVYDRFGYVLAANMDERMRRWLVEDAHDKKPAHRYGLDQFGLNREAIEQRFGPYCERFGVVPEVSKR